MKVDLSGLRALVTGFTKGIGRAIAHALAKNGAEVAINGRKPADVETGVDSATCWGRLPAAVGDFVFVKFGCGGTLELGRSGR